MTQLNPHVSFVFTQPSRERLVSDGAQEPAAGRPWPQPGTAAWQIVKLSNYSQTKADGQREICAGPVKRPLQHLQQQVRCSTTITVTG